MANDFYGAYPVIETPFTASGDLDIELDSYVAVEKYLLHRQGVLKNRVVREPAGYSLDRETMAQIDRYFRTLEDVVATAGEDVPPARPDMSLGSR